MAPSSPPDPLPESLSTTLGKLVYLYVRERGGARVYDLRDALGVPQLSLYPTLEGLADCGLVRRRGDDVWVPDADAPAPDAPAPEAPAPDAPAPVAGRRS